MASSKPKGEELYFIAVVIDGALGDEIYNLKEYVAKEFASKAALRSPPHITLHMPFKKKSRHENELVQALAETASNHPPFEIALKNFGSFGKRVIFIDVQPSEVLSILQADVHKMSKLKFNLHNANPGNHPFTPHVTIAFRDLSRPEFDRAWEKFGTTRFEQRHQCRHISLLKHNGKFWETYEEIPLLGNRLQRKGESDSKDLF